MGRLLGLDVGKKRVGVAVSDETRTIASAVGVWPPKSGEVARRIAAYPDPLDRIIVGLPLNVDGSDSEQTERVRGFARRLQAGIRLPVEFADERYSTLTAEEVMQAGGLSREERKKKSDQQAAVVILQGWLDGEEQRAR